MSQTRITPMRMRAVQLVANNWAMRKRAPRVCQLAHSLGFYVSM